MQNVVWTTLIYLDPVLSLFTGNHNYRNWFLQMGKLTSRHFDRTVFHHHPASKKTLMFVMLVMMTAGKRSQKLLESKHAGQQFSIREEQEIALVSTLHPNSSKPFTNFTETQPWHRSVRQGNVIASISQMEKQWQRHRSLEDTDRVNRTAPLADTHSHI